LHSGLVLYGFAHQMSATSLPMWAYVTSGCVWTAGVGACVRKHLEQKVGTALLCEALQHVTNKTGVELIAES
jgi:hypothetical protein